MTPAQFYVLASVLALAISTGCGDPGFFVQNNPGEYVPAALDLQNCEVLARNQFEPSDETRSEYDIAVRQARIIQLKNGTNVKQDWPLNFENEHLVQWTPTGPITVAEEVQRHIRVYQWMFPKEGPYRGTKVCLSVSMLRAKYPPL